jgi:hypothetical protein
VRRPAGAVVDGAGKRSSTRVGWGGSVQPIDAGGPPAHHPGGPVLRPAARAFVALSLALAPLALGAQAAPARGDDASAVRRAALDYIEGFYEGDSTKLMRSVSTDVFKYGYYIPRDSARYTGERMTWPEFLSYARSVKARNRPVPAEWPKEVTVYEVLDQTASAKVVANWGIDYLLLAKRDGRWMITHVLWQTPPRR